VYELRFERCSERGRGDHVRDQRKADPCRV
jgi:hypothetical protein